MAEERAIRDNLPRNGVAKKPAKRHMIAQITKSMIAADKTTFILPETNVDEDVLMINSGRSVRDGNRYTVSGRTYEQQANGTLFPLTGSGFLLPVDRPVIHALQAIARYNGPNEEAMHEISMRDIADEHREQAIAIWRLREKQ